MLLISALVLALHWLALSRLSLGHSRTAQPPAAPVLIAHSIAATPPAAVRTAQTPKPAAIPSPPPASPRETPQPPAAEILLADSELPGLSAELDHNRAETNAAEAGAAPAPETPASAPQATAPPAPQAPSGAGADSAPPGDASASGDKPAPAAPPVQLPAPMRLLFDVSGQARKFAYQARAELLWQHDGRHYEARQEIGAFLVGARRQSSLGRITPQGLLPERFSDRSSKGQWVHFDHSAGRVRFGAETADAAIDPGAQDRLSVFIQLGALLAADPARRAPGARTTLTAVGARSAERWTFTVEGPETLDLPVGSTPALKLLRLPRNGQEQTAEKAELWLAPALGHLPARIRLTQANSDFADLRLRSSSALLEPK